jgi:hypothetical protein
MRFFRNLSREEAKMIALIVPIVNINLFHVRGGMNKLSMPRVKKNIISFYQPTASIIKTLPRSVVEIGSVDIRTRSRRQAGYSIAPSVYGPRKTIRPKDVILAFSCLAGKIPGMNNIPLHPEYSSVLLNASFEHDVTAQLNSEADVLDLGVANHNRRAAACQHAKGVCSDDTTEYYCQRWFIRGKKYPRETVNLASDFDS